MGNEKEDLFQKRLETGVFETWQWLRFIWHMAGVSGKQVIMKRKAFFAFLIGMLILSGCRQNENSAEPVNGSGKEDGDMKFKENEEKAQEGKGHASSEILPELSEVAISEKAQDIPYYSEDGIDLLGALHRCVSDGENIYFVYGGPDIYVMPIGTNKHYPAGIANPQGMDVCNIALDAHGRIHLLMAGQDNREWFIWRLDENYEVEKTIDISSCFETRYIPLWFLTDKDGAYFFQWPLDRNGIIVDGEGALKHKFTPESLGTKWIYEAAVGKDGHIYLVYGDSGVKLEIGKLDTADCFLENENPALFFAGDEVFNAMSCGTDANLLLFSPYSGVWAYDSERGIVENRVSLSDIGFGAGMECWPLTFLPDGRLLLVAKMAEGQSFPDWLFRYVPVSKEPHENGK